MASWNSPSGGASMGCLFFRPAFHVADDPDDLMQLGLPSKSKSEREGKRGRERERVRESERERERESSVKSLSVGNFEDDKRLNSILSTHARQSSLQVAKSFIQSMQSTLHQQTVPERLSQAWWGEEGEEGERKGEGEAEGVEEGRTLRKAMSAMALRSRQSAMARRAKSEAGVREEVRWEGDERELERLLEAAEVSEEGGKRMRRKSSFRDYVFGKNWRGVSDVPLLPGGSGSEGERESAGAQERMGGGGGGGGGSSSQRREPCIDQCTAVEKIREHSRTSRGTRLKLAELGAIKTLLDILGSGAKCDVTELAIIALLNLSLEPELKEEIVNEGGLKYLMSELQAAIFNCTEGGGDSLCPSVETCIGLISSLALAKETRQLLLTTDIVSLFVGLIGKEIVSERAHKDLTCGLLQLTLEEVGQDQLVSLGCVEAIFNVIEEDPSGRFVEDSMALLLQLVKFSRARFKVIMLGGIAGIGSVLEAGSPLAQGLALKTLFFVSLDNEDAIHMVLEEDLLIPVAVATERVSERFKAFGRTLTRVLQQHL